MATDTYLFRLIAIDTSQTLFVVHCNHVILHTQPGLLLADKQDYFYSSATNNSQ